MNDNKLEMNEIERQAEETVNSIEKSIVPFLFFSFFIGIPLMLPFILLFVEFLGYSRNVFLIFAIILMVIFLFICFLIFYIEEKKFKKILKNNEEYRLAKEVIKNYENKVFEYKKKKVEEKKQNEYKDVIYKEKEKHERINELERYLANERKRKENK